MGLVALSFASPPAIASSGSAGACTDLTLSCAKVAYAWGCTETLTGACICPVACVVTLDYHYEGSGSVFAGRASWADNFGVAGACDFEGLLDTCASEGYHREFALSPGQTVCLRGDLGVRDEVDHGARAFETCRSATFLPVGAPGGADLHGF